jgi:hypothetical protein
VFRCKGLWLRLAPKQLLEPSATASAYPPSSFRDSPSAATPAFFPLSCPQRAHITASARHSQDGPRGPHNVCCTSSSHPREAILTNRRYLVRRGNHNAHHLLPPNLAMQSCKIHPLPARLSRSALPFCSRRILPKKKSTCRSHEPPRIPASPQLLHRKRPHLPTMHTIDPHQRRLHMDTRLRGTGNNHRRQSEQSCSRVTHEY